jgi:hypothetical protein
LAIHAIIEVILRQVAHVVQIAAVIVSGLIASYIFTAAG